jgi:predicted TIM-barrel fold metal-dependent hydrolase
MRIAFHIGTDGENIVFRGRGGALLNFAETTYGGQRAVAQMISSGVFDRHPNLKVLVSEGGATWVPFLGDRLNEIVRQQPFFVWPKLEMLPKEYMNQNVYASFQHDETAIPTMTAMGYRNVMFGSDYPHLEGTYGHTQETLHHLFDGVDDDVRDRITTGAFLDLFPHVGKAPR